MKNDIVYVKVLLTVKPECREAFERELMAIRQKCIAEIDCLMFDVERRSDDPNIFLLTEAWADRENFEKIQMKREYYPPYFAKIDPMMAAPRQLQYWNRVASYRKANDD